VDDQADDIAEEWGNARTPDQIRVMLQPMIAEMCRGGASLFGVPQSVGAMVAAGGGGRNSWIEFVKKVRAQAAAKGEHLSWKDALKRASALRKTSGPR